MKTIRKKSVVSLPPASGNITDTFNIIDKSRNAPSINLMEELEKRIYENIYPIGRVIIDENVDEEGNGIDYSKYLGFTWEKTLKGVSPIGLDEEDIDFSVMSNSGGEKTHTQTIDEMPSHTHVQNQHRHSVFSYNDESKLDGSGNPAHITSSGNDYAYEIRGTRDTRGLYTSGYATATNQNTGGGQPMNNMHPYKVVAFWKRIA